MSLDLYQDEARQAISNLRPVTVPETGTFDGFIRGSGMYAMRGFAAAGRAIDLAGSVGPMAEDAIFGTGTEAQDRYFKEHDEVFGSAVEHWTPNPQEVGVAAEVVGGLLSTLPLIIASPSLAVATTQLGVGEELVKKGVDAGKAQAVGAVQGAALGVGVWMPILGQNGWQRVVVGGAGANLVLGVGARGTSGVILDGTKAAEEYQAFDGKALTLDVLLGAAFGTLVHLSPAQRAQGAAAWERVMNWASRMDPSEVDAVAGLRQSQHLNLDSAPGKLATPRDVEAHSARMRAAIDQLAKGEQVSVDDMPGAAFEVDAKRQAAAEKRVADLEKISERVQTDEGLAPIPGKEYPVTSTLTPEQQGIERRFYQQLEDTDAAIKAYSRRADTDGGKIISTDIARELSTDYSATKASRSKLSPTVHEPASAFVKRLYAKKLEEPSASGLNMVTFTAGGAGAGKTSGIAETPIASKIVEVSDVVYDTNMNKFESAAQKIDQALAAGKQVNIIYTGRDPIEALVGGNIPRAERMGRTVVLKEHSRTHQGSVDSITKLLEHYKGNDRVQFVFIDNTRGKGGATIAGPELLKQFNFENLDARLKEALDAEYGAGRVSDNVYEGIAGHPPGKAPVDDAAGTGGVRGRAGEAGPQRERAQGVKKTGAPAASAGGGTEPPPPRGSRDQGEAAGAEAKPDPYMLEAEAIAAERPDLRIRVATAVDGEPVTMTAQEFLEYAKQSAARIREDGDLVQVAAQCLLGVA